MFQQRLSQLIQPIADSRKSLIYCGSVLLAANLLWAGEPEKATGLLWMSPATVDYDHHVRQLSDPVEPAPLDTQDESAGDTSHSPSVVIPHDADADDVAAVFGDVIPELSSPRSESPAAERVAAKPLATSSRSDKASDSSHDRPQATRPLTDSAENSLRRQTEAPESQPTIELPAHVTSLRVPLERCLQVHEVQLLNSGEHSCWSMMHAFLGWGPTTRIRVGSARGQSTELLAWFSQNQFCAGRQLLYVANGRIKGREGPGYQGHPAQFLAMLAQNDIPAEHALQVHGEEMTVQHLINEEQLTCRNGVELTFKLIGLSHYLDTNASWRNERGETWDFPRIVRAELAEPINGAACGGTHRIMGLTYAVKKRREQGQPIKGQWWRADKFVKDYQKYTMGLQNRDGSFSSDWFKRRANSGDVDRKIQTTGHILEWLVFSLDDKDLHDPRVARSVALLTNVLIQDRYREWENGPKGHAIRALRLYHERVFGGDWNEPGQSQRPPLVEQPRRERPRASARVIDPLKPLGRLLH